MQLRKLFCRGDTIVEVLFAITIFSLLTMIAFSLMQSGVASAEANMERTEVRAEMDAQAEAIRFIHNSYLAEREFSTASQEYKDLWDALVANAQTVYSNSSLDTGACPASPANAIVINTRSIQPGDVDHTIYEIETMAGSETYEIPTTFANVVYGASTANSSLASLRLIILAPPAKSGSDS